MSGFGFTEEQELFRKEIRKFTDKEVAPGYKERSKKTDFPWELSHKMGELGLLGLTMPPKYGGQPTDWITTGIATEELGRGDLPWAQIPGINILHYMVLSQGSEELRREWLPPMIRGENMYSLCLTEPECGSDAAAIRARATKDGDDYLISGEKTSITLGMFASAAHVYAKTNPQAGARGVSCFWVPLDLPGVSRSPISDTGWKFTGRASIVFDNVRVPASYRIGREGEGFYTVMKEFDFMRVVLAFCSLGAAQASLEEAIAYAKERTAFGRPIAKFEGVSFKIAEHATLIEAARMLCYRTLWLRDQGLPHTKETAMCKWFGMWVAFNAIHDCLLMHGHFGFTEDLPFEQRLRDVIGFEIGDGTPEIMKTVVSREILGREFLPYR